MSHSFSEHPDSAMLEVVLVGAISLDEAHQVRLRAAELCRERCYTRLLVDTRGTTGVGGGSTLDLFDLGSSEMEQIGLPRETRIALVLPASQSASMDWGFLATVEQNRGWLVQPFANVLDAREWLGLG